MSTRIEIERVVVHGATGDGLRATDLGALVERAVHQALADGSLPNGRAIHSVVNVKAGPLTTGAAIAGAVAMGVSQAMSGGRAHG
jgi:type IV secretory pathway VirB2 component (pilin)